ncbi:tripartite motif-containing protein 30A-like [Patella vulgata]|uniref:tripartite motif-containing protein 30A-like n=1 Tax=Patella vulgata TaxID=6465 RepID=UPI00217FED84|nr:tripartite motif-containing protein 30A-like [Patella vulgata]
MATKMECSICLCDFKNPKIIDCFHTFCKNCLDDYISNKSENGHFPCPTCRKVIRIPEQFATNFYLSQQTEGSESRDAICGNVSTIPDDESESRMCVNHMKEIDLYCKQCNVSMCYKCFITDHNGHSVSDLNDFKLETKLEIQSLRGELENTLLKYQQYSESIQLQKKEIETQTLQICTKIDKRVDKLCAALRLIGSKMQNEVTQSHAQAEKETTSSESLANELLKETKNLLKEISDDVDHIGVSQLLVLKTKLLREIENGKKDLVVPEPNTLSFQEGEMNKIQLTNQLGQIKTGMKKNDTEIASNHNSGVDIQKTIIFQFNLRNGRKIHFIGNSDVEDGGVSFWRYASIRNDKLSLQLELKVLDSFTGLLPTKILINLRLLNKRNHQRTKIKQLTIQLKERYKWEDIISMDELENPSLGYIDDQRVFTFRLVVLRVTIN